jgi:CheY-like chemotaxis protein
MRTAAVRLLRELGYATHEAGDGPAALQILSNGDAIDLLFTDVVMPGGLSGYDVAAAARAMRPGVRVLFTSGFPAAAQASGGQATQEGPLLSKPYRRDDLARAVRAVLEGPTGARS